MFDQLPHIADQVQQFVSNPPTQAWQQIQQFNPIEHIQQWIPSFQAPAPKDVPVSTSSIG